MVAQRLLRSFGSEKKYGSVGYCTPYRAQANLVRSVIKADGLDEKVSVGTIHVFQGDEKDTIILDTVAGYGDFASAGAHITQDHPSRAQLMIVAASRASQRLIIIANLKLLDQKLPAKAFLRTLLAAAVEREAVVPVEQLIETRQLARKARADLLKRHEEVKRIRADLETKSAALKDLEARLKNPGRNCL